MRFRTNTMLTPTGKVKVRTTTRVAPIAPPFEHHQPTFSLVPPAPASSSRKSSRKKR